MPFLTFHRLEIEGWRQFEDVEIDFHPRLTVITGTNGSGKSTLLSLCARHFGFNRLYLSTPIKDASGRTSYQPGLILRVWHRLRRDTTPQQPQAAQMTIGSLTYSNNHKAPLRMLNPSNVQYQIEIPSQQKVDGVHIDAYRPAPTYSTVTTIPMQPITPMQAYSNYNAEIINRASGTYTNSTPIFRLKEALMAMAVFGEGNSTIGSDKALYATFNGFTEVLRKLLPAELGFNRIAIRNPEIAIITSSGEFMIDAASGGLSTLIDIAWRIYMFSLERNEPFVVTMDEPENHLHPSMQRSLLRRLLQAFPRAQFIVATHSPFIVSSIKDSYVYVLRYSENGAQPNFPAATSPVDPSRRVSSVRLDKVDKSRTAGEILREVLGVPVTMPEWVEEDLSAVNASFIGKPITKELLADLRKNLSDLGYSDYFAEALAGITQP